MLLQGLVSVIGISTLMPYFARMELVVWCDGGGGFDQIYILVQGFKVKTPLKISINSTAIGIHF